MPSKKLNRAIGNRPAIKMFLKSKTSFNTIKSKISFSLFFLFFGTGKTFQKIIYTKKKRGKENMATKTKTPSVKKFFYGSKIESEKNLVEMDKSGKVLLQSVRVLANDKTFKTSFSISKEAISQFNKLVGLGEVEKARQFSISGKPIIKMIMENMKLHANQRGDEKTPSKWNKPRYVFNRFVHTIGRDDLRHEFGQAKQKQDERVAEIKKQFKNVNSYLQSQK